MYACLFLVRLAAPYFLSFPLYALPTPYILPRHAAVLPPLWWSQGLIWPKPPFSGPNSGFGPVVLGLCWHRPERGRLRVVTALPYWHPVAGASTRSKPHTHRPGHVAFF